MNSLNYIGSKKTLYSTIYKICNENINELQNKDFADLFSGTGIMSYNNLDNFASITSNDLEYYSYIILNGLIKCNYSERLNQIINELNDLDYNDIDENNGIIYKYYSPHNNCERMFFTNNNAKKCDKCIQYIKQLKENNLITSNEYNFLLGSIIISLDKLANTSSVYGAYLKSFKASALKELEIKPLHTKININENVNSVYNKDINELIKEKEFDIVYLDPPYNHRQYSSNYSPLNYIAHYDEEIRLKGKSGLIENYNKSEYCSKTKVKNSFQELFENIKCNHIFLSYNNEGLMNIEQLKEILLEKGDTKLYKIKYKKFKAQQNVNEAYVYEYLFYINCNEKNNLYEELDYELQ
jgi:adenine-specific DNA-methyltransferase